MGGKRLDLSKAHKQTLLHPEHRDLAFIRVSRSLSFLLNKVALIPSSVFFDDFPLFTPSSSGEEADQGPGAGAGGPPLALALAFDVLGLNLRLEAFGGSVLGLGNKAGRLENIAAWCKGCWQNLKLRRSSAGCGLAPLESPGGSTGQ